MGEEKKDKASGKDAGEKKDAAGGGEKAAAAAPGPIVLKVELHCAGCASKVKKAIKRAPGTCARLFAARSVGVRPLVLGRDGLLWWREQVWRRL
jgi:hypothetical protein